MSSSASSLEATLGGLLVSVLIATFLYAITCFQAFLYWRTKFNDYLGVRVLVSLSLSSILKLCQLFHAKGLGSVVSSYVAPLAFKYSLLSSTTIPFRVFETMHTTCFWFYLYTILVKYYGVPQEMEQRHWSVTISIVFHGLITACVQVLYTPSCRILIYNFCTVILLLSRLRFVQWTLAHSHHLLDALWNGSCWSTCTRDPLLPCRPSGMDRKMGIPCHNRYRGGSGCRSCEYNNAVLLPP